MAKSGGDGSIILSTKIDTKGIKQGLNSITKAAGTAFLAVGAAAATATVAITKMAVSAYADFEQLSGGAQLLFGEAYDYIIKRSEDAFASVQLSQNEYLRQVNGFATGLKTALGGNEMAAAQLADKIVRAEADVVAATGQTQEAVQNAFNGIMKSNFTMVDNLMIGITPTKEGYQEMIDKVNAWNEANGRATKYQMGNLADMESALVDYIEMVGMRGYAEREAAETIQGSAAMTKAAWENVMIAISSGGNIDKAMNNFVYSIDKLFNNLTPVIERSLLGIGQIIEKVTPQLVQIAANSLIRALPMFVTTLYQVVIAMLEGVWQGVKDVFAGKKVDFAATLNESVESVGVSANGAAEGMEALGDETEKAGKKAKKSLAAFDDLQILADNSSSETTITEPTIAGGGGGGATTGGEDATRQKEQEINTTLANIMAAVGAAMIALGVLCLFLGNVSLGIGLIALGALSMGVAIGQLSQTDAESGTIQMITTIMGVVGGALIAIGVMLLFLGVGTMPIAIGMIIAGAALLVGAAGTMAGAQPSDIEGWLAIIMGIAGGAMLALGIILCMVGSVPLGVGLIIAGAVVLVSAFAINNEELTSQITGWVAIIMGIAGGALLVLGIILTCSGSLPLGIALIAAGAVALVTPIALNWEAIVEQLQGPIGAITAIVGGALLVLGIILVCCGVLPLGIALIVAGAAALVTVVAVNWDAIVEWVKGAWDAVKAFWNEYIAPVFTKEWWLNLAKEAGNGILKGFEGAINGVITMFENMINWIVEKINTLSFNIPDFLGGGHFGFDLKPVKFKRVSIPKLAQGAVIPPNKEFLAILGDQKRGTNIEAPLDTIVEAFNIALAQNGGGSGGDTTVVLEIDGREFGNAVIKQGQREAKRLGTRLVMA